MTSSRSPSFRVLVAILLAAATSAAVVPALDAPQLPFANVAAAVVDHWPPHDDDLYGPHFITASPSGDTWYEDFFSTRLVSGAKYYLKVNNPAPDGPGVVANFSVMLNGVYVADPAMMGGQAELVKEIPLQAWNRIEVWTAPGAGQLRVIITIVPMTHMSPAWAERVQPDPGQINITKNWQVTVPADAGGNRVMVVDNGDYDRTGRIGAQEWGEVKINGVRAVWLDTLHLEQSKLVVPVTLPAGTSTIEATLGNAVPGAHIHVRVMYADTAKPKLVVSAPANGAVVSSASVTVSGTYDDPMWGSVNVGSAASYQSVWLAHMAGVQSWSVSHPLNEGSNTIKIWARDGAGNTSDTVTRVVIRDTQAPALAVSAHAVNPGPTIERDECLTIAAGDDAAYECGDLRLVHELPGARTMNRHRAVTLMYNSTHAKARAIIAANVSLPSGMNANSLEATVLVPGRPNTVRNFTWNPLWSGAGVRRIVGPIDGLALCLTTGMYDYTLQVRAMSGTSALATGSDTGSVVIVDRSASQFGTGWWLEGYEQLFDVSSSRKLWIGGDGSTRLYRQQTDTSLWIATPAVDRPDTLRRMSGSAFQRFLPNGGFVEFNSAGHHTATQNRQGHRTTFAYTHPASSSTLTSIALPVFAGTAPAYTFGYSTDANGSPYVLTSVVSPSVPSLLARTTVLRYRSGTRWLEQIQDVDTKTINFRYDAANRIDMRQNRRGDSTFFAYDEADLLRQVTIDMRRTSEPAIVSTFCPGESRSVASCASGPQLLASVYTRLDGSRTDVADTTTFTVTRFGAPSVIVNALGHRTTIERTDSTRFPTLITAVVRPNDFRTEAFYSARGLLDSTRSINPFRSGNAVTRYAWHPKWAMVVRTILPTGQKDSVFYNATTGNREWQEDGRGAMSRTTFTYDARNRVEYIQSPGNSAAQRERIQYDDFDDVQLGNVWKVTTALGFASEMLSDAIGRDTLIKTPFDSLQQSHRTTQIQYDSKDRPTLVVDGPGLSVRTIYDAEGLPIDVRRWSTPDPAGVGEIRDTLTYDAAGRKIESRDGYRAGVFETWTYDAADNLLNYLRRTGQTTPMTYDVLNRLRTREVSSVGSEKTSVPSDVEQFDYDELGNLTVADNRFARIRRSYYPSGALDTDTLRINVSDVSTNDYERHVYGLKSFYDLAGRRVALKHPATIAIGGDSVAYHYHSVTGLLSAVHDVSGAEYSFAYDSAQRPIRLASPGDIVDTTIYDADSRRKRRIELQYPGGISRELHRDGFVYDGAGRVLSAGTASPLHAGSFEYTILGAVAKTTEAVEWTQSFSIDAFANRADYRKWTDESNTIYTHVYDPHSTRLTGVGGRILGGEKEGRDTLTQGYNLAGDLTGVTYYTFVDTTPTLPYAGPKLWAVSSFATARHIYSGIGRLSFVDRSTSEDIDKTDPQRLQQQGYSKMLTSNPSLGPGVYEEYRYDALGRRVWVRAHRDPPYCNTPTSSRHTECLGAVQRTVWDGDNVLYEIRQEAQANTSASTLELDRAASYPGRSGHFGIVGYTHGPGIDRPLALRRHLGDFDGGLVQLTLHRDWRGMVSTSSYAVGPNAGSRAECRFVGDSLCIYINWPATTHTVNRSRSPSDSGPPSWYGTLAQEHRDGSGSLYKRNRYYDPGTQRFTQEDPIGLAGGTNLYGFADGDPVNYSDPFGLCPIPQLCAFIAVAGGSALGAAAYQVYQNYRSGSDLSAGVGTAAARGLRDGAASALAGMGIGALAAGAAAGTVEAAGAASASSALNLGSKAAARAALAELGLPNAQASAAGSAISRATTTSTIDLIRRESGDVLVNVSRPGRNGFQVMQSVISPNGAKRVTQYTVNRAGRIFADPKLP